METWPRDLSRLASQCSCTVQWDTTCRRIGNWTEATWIHTVPSQLARLVERRCIVDPERPRRAIDHLGLDAEFGTLPGYQDVIAARSSSCSCRTIEIQWLTALQGNDPVHRPATKYQICRSSMAHVRLALTEGQFIPAAEVHNMSNIEVG